MKREKFFSLLWSVVIGFLIAYGGVSCLISAFGLLADTRALVFCCLGFAVFAGVLLQTKWGGWILTLCILLSGIISWMTGDLRDSVWLLLHAVSRVYDRAYGWGVLQIQFAVTAVSVDLALQAIAILLLWVVTYVMHRKMPALGAVFAAALPLLACMVVTDTVPSTGSLFWLFLGVLLLMLTQTVRRMSVTDGNRLVAILLLPALLASFLLFWAVPQRGYTPPESAPAWLQELFSYFTSGSMTDGGTGIPSDKMDLSNVGPKADQRFVVLEVEAQRGGTYYLRGQSFDIYTGTSWEISSEFGETDPYFPATGLVAKGFVTIYLRMNANKQYLPYYTPRMSEIRYGYYPNSGSRSYNLQWYEPGLNTRIEGVVMNDALVTQCLDLPESTRIWAEFVLQKLGITAKQSVDEKVQIIGSFVEQSALYDKNTEKMPQGYGDFARWFLEESETGYCVHFATAAVVLLRAAGIPARYVTGYLAEIGGVKTTVLANQSHAWVEYLDYQRGWTVIDPTPPEPEVQPTETTLPILTEQPTETTAPPTDVTEGSTQATEYTGGTQVVTRPETAPTTGDVREEEIDRTGLWQGLLALVYGMLAVAAVLGQYVLRIRLRHGRRRGSANDQALAMWKEIVHFSRLYSVALPEELIDLAEKAKFSQHTLLPSEVREFKLQLRKLSQVLSEKPWYARLFWKLIFAAE